MKNKAKHFSTPSIVGGTMIERHHKVENRSCLTAPSYAKRILGLTLAAAPTASLGGAIPILVRAVLASEWLTVTRTKAKSLTVWSGVPGFRDRRTVPMPGYCLHCPLPLLLLHGAESPRGSRLHCLLGLVWNGGNPLTKQGAIRELQFANMWYH